MNKLRLVILLILISKIGYSQFSSDHYYPKEVIRQLKIKSCEIYIINRTQNKADSVLDEKINYDSLGNEIEIIWPKDKFIYTYKYNKLGQKVEEDLTSLDADLNEKDTFYYNDYGKLYKDIRYSNKRTESTRTEYEFKDSLPVKELYYVTNKLITVYANIYNEKNKLIRVKMSSTYRNEDNVYKYDEQNNMTYYTRLTTKGDTLGYQKFTYDGDNRRVRQDIYGIDKKLNGVYKTNYDSSGLIISEESFEDIKNGDIKECEYKIKIYKYR